MIKRLYINNYRCLENFELPISGKSSSLLIGKNGTGKSTIGAALRVLQRIARGTNQVGDLVSTEDFSFDRSAVPIRFDLEVLIHDELYRYQLALELPQGFKEMRVAEERLSKNGIDIYIRETAQVTLPKESMSDTRFIVDWHLVALPIIQASDESDPIHIFKNWLARMLILAPIPSYISGDSTGDTLMPDKECLNFGAWFAGLLAHSPAAYADIDKFIREVLPDFKDIKNPIIGKDSRSLSVQFQKDGESLNLEFKKLSDGEKCFFICALVLASNKAYGPIFCFWDEPDNYISLAEAGHFIMAMRQSFGKSGQLLVTSHNSEAIRRFSAENTFLLDRHSHLEPTLVRLLEEVTINGDLISALIRDDVAI